MSTEIRVPTLGESVTEATVATWFKKPGDTVDVDEMLCELETDKVTVEVPSPVAGVLSDIVAAEGETVGVDALLGNISESGNAGPEETKPRSENAKKTDAEEPPNGGPSSGGPSSSGSDTAAKGSGETVKVMVPALGESVTEATIATWFKKEGDSVEADEMLCELETDKVSVEVPAPAAGVLSRILKGEGETVEAGGQLAVLSAGAGGSTAQSAPKVQEEGARGAAVAAGAEVEGAEAAETARATSSFMTRPSRPVPVI